MSWRPRGFRWRSARPSIRRILQAKQDAVSKAEGLQKEGAQQALRSWQVRWIKYLVVTKQYAMAGGRDCRAVDRKPHSGSGGHRSS